MSKFNILRLRGESVLIKLYEQSAIIECARCGKDIINGDSEKGPGILIIAENSDGYISEVIPSCKGRCDDELSRSINVTDGWKDISEFINPLSFMQNSMAILNRVYEGKLSEKAFTTYKKVLFEHVFGYNTN